MIKNIVFILIASFWSITILGQSYVSLLTDKVSYIEIPDGVNVNGSINLTLGAFKYNEDTLMCVGGGNVTPGDPDYIRVNWATDSYGYIPGDTLFILVLDRDNSCSIVMDPVFEQGNGIENMMGTDDTVRVTSYTLEEGSFEYDWDVQDGICVDLTRLISSVTNVNNQIRLNYSVNKQGFEFYDANGFFRPDESLEGSYIVTLKVDGISSYCWRGQENTQLINIVDKESRAVEQSEIIDTILSQQCNEPGVITINELKLREEWQSIFFNEDEYQIRGTNGRIELGVGVYSVNGYDQNGCSFYSEDIEVLSSGDCEDAFYIFSTQNPNVIDFKEEGTIRVRNRAGVVVKELNCPCSWNGESESGGLLDFGLYMVELPNGTVKKLKYYR